MTQGPLTRLPEDLPIPRDDGACRHLPGKRLPDLPLLATSGESVNLGRLPGITVLFAYPMTGWPGMVLPPDWLAIPGAPGCTLETCGFRDHHAEIVAHGARIFGLSSQSTAAQGEAKERLRLPFDLLADDTLAFASALSLPTFSAGSGRFIKRLTLICRDGVIEHVFYPVFPPDTHYREVIARLSAAP